MGLSLLWLFVLTAVSATAQETVFRETFENNDRKWIVGTRDDGEVKRTIENGKYVCEMTSDAGWENSSQEVALPMNKNFIVTVKVRQISGALDNEFGFFYNGADASNLYEFTISSDKNARVRRYKEGEKLSVTDQRKLSAIKPQGEWNVLEMWKVNDAIAFFVNDQYLDGYDASYLLDFGDKFGVFFRWSQVVEYDEIQILQWDLDPVRVAEGAKTDAQPVNLGSAINGTSDDLIDCISPDGSVLVFSRKGDSRNIGDPEKRDVWFSTRADDGSWTVAKNPGAPLNTPTNNFAVAITQDLNTVFMQGRYYSDGTSAANGNVSESQRSMNGWSVPRLIPVINLSNKGGIINSHISPDGQVMLLSIEDESSYGANDLYVCFRTTMNGGPAWTEPKNLGETLNTVGLEMGPFIAADGKTVYFSSNGHPGFGGRDLYVTRRLDDTWLNWSPPENLGTPINTDEHETFFQVPAKGDSGYYTSTKNSLGASDIFSIALPSGAKPLAVSMIRGRVLDAETNEPVGASVVYEKLPEGSVVGKASSDPSTGNYRVALGMGAQYGVRAEADGYYPLSETFDTRELIEFDEVDKDLYLTPIRSNAIIRLNNLFFDTGRYDLRPESFPELDRLVAFLNARAGIRIELQGHTDNVGSTDSNKRLSQNRVNSVKTYLVNHGISKDRLDAKGFGESKPIGDNATEEGRQQNRRVQFRIIEN